MNEAGLSTSERHWIARAGSSSLDIGDEEAFKKTAKKVSKRFLITPEELKQGIRLNINAGTVFDIDNVINDGNADRTKYYKRYGFN